MYHLVEAKEVLDGGGRVEDVAFSRHHQHKAVQRLKTKEKKLYSDVHVGFSSLPDDHCFQNMYNKHV